MLAGCEGEGGRGGGVGEGEADEGGVWDLGDGGRRWLLGGVVAVEDEEEVHRCRFEDVDTEVDDVEVEEREDGEGEGDVEGVEDAVGVVADVGEDRGADEHEAGDGSDAELHVGVSDPFGQEAHLQVEIQVECGVGGEECGEDVAEGAVVGVEFFVGEACEVLDGVVGGFGGEKVVKG